MQEQASRDGGLFDGDEKVTGYCMVWDVNGIPSLVEEEVRKLSDTQFLLPQYDGDGDLSGYMSLSFGVDFFYHEAPALAVLIQRLQDAYNGHTRALERVKALIAKAQAAFKGLADA